jgi:DNA modification methylase
MRKNESLAKAITKPGDIWQLGQHRLICGDCSKVNTVAKLFAGERAELCFTSLLCNVKWHHTDKPRYADDLSHQENLEFLTAFTDLALAQCDYMMVNLQRGDNYVAAKSLHMVEHTIKNFSQRGAVIYIPFCGTGTMIIVCERLNRRCFAVSLDPQGCDTAVKRFQKLTGKKAELC